MGNLLSLKILHLPSNVASQLSVTLRCQLQLGCNVHGLVRYSSEYLSNDGLQVIEIIPIRKSLLSSIGSRLKWQYYAIKEICWADVIHWHFGSNRVLPFGLDMVLICLLKKKCVIEFYGSDIRIPEIACRNNKYLADFLSKSPQAYSISKKTSIRNQKYFAQFGFKCLIPAVELMAYIDEKYFKKPYEIRVGIIVDDYKTSYSSNTNAKLMIVHTPSNIDVKGTSKVIEVIEQLKKKYNFDFELITGKKHETALSAIRNCDLFLDQFIIGDYGVSSIEAMAFGKAVVCYITENVYRQLPGDCPIINANFDNLYSKLAEILKYPQVLKSYGVQGRKYVEKYHDAFKNSKRMLEMYNDL